MAYASEADAGHRITSITHGGTELKGPLGVTLEKVVEREVRQAGANNAPVSRPVAFLDARVTARFLDTAGGISETAAAASLVANFTDGAGDAGSVTMGPLKAGSIRHTMERNQGGFAVEQDFELEGATLTYTPAI